MSDLLREIDADIAKDKSERFVEQWGLPIGIFVLILFAGLFFFFTWQDRSERRAFDEADRFAQAVEELANDPQSAAALFDGLASSNSGFAELAAFKAGDALLAAGDQEGALAAWLAYVQDDTANPYLVLTTRFKIAWFGNGVLEPFEIIEQIDILEQVETYAPYAPILHALRLLDSSDTAAARALLEEASAAEGSAGADLAFTLLGLVKTL